MQGRVIYDDPSKYPDKDDVGFIGRSRGLKAQPSATTQGLLVIMPPTVYIVPAHHVVHARVLQAKPTHQSVTLLRMSTILLPGALQLGTAQRLLCPPHVLLSTAGATGGFAGGERGL